MPTYNFTSDLRISVLPERIQTAATEIVNHELSSDKSASNNRATLAFYFNLIEGTNTLKLAANGSITEVVRNFVLKFQFPNTYTAEIFNKNVEEHTLIAPLRETVKLLAYQYFFDGEQNAYLTFDEIKFFVFGNPDLFKGAIPDDYKSIISKIKNNRNLNHDYASEINYLIEWKQYDRQARELISIIPYACDSFMTSSGKLILSMPNPMSEKFADSLKFIASAMEEEKMWIPEGNAYNQAVKESYISYMDINGEVDLCKQADPIIDLTSIDSLSASLQQIFYGAPGTGKSYAISEMINPENSIRTTFHPDSDYSTFVGAYKPSMDDEEAGSKDIDNSGVAISKDETNDNGYGSEKNSSSAANNRIVYKFIPQAFLKAYVAAWKAYATKTPFYLIIEEINRGNCAQIFGDLFQLLDRNDNGFSSYPISPDNDIQKFLSKDKEGFLNLESDNKNAHSAISEICIKDKKKNCIAKGEDILSGKKLMLPPNIFIWATMNTSDQSLFPIDSAFKRRWDWKYVRIKEGKDKAGNPLHWMIDLKYVKSNPEDASESNEVPENSADNSDSVAAHAAVSTNAFDWWQFIKAINKVIASMTSSSDKQLGYFFCKANQDGIIDGKTFVGKVLFYLWNDVFKDYGFDDPSLFQYSIIVDGKQKVCDLVFEDFYDEDDDEKINADRVADFINKVLVWKKDSAKSDY